MSSGPKIKEGDRQSPEGFYTITASLLNPKSNYYLSFDTGFPNKFDRAHGRTGSNLMVHGDCSSRGCYSMTDESIAEIYALVRESLKGGNSSVQLQIFPFRMNAANLAKHASSPHMSFWKDIKEGYDRFELTKTPPSWDVCNKEYVFDVPRTAVLEASAACPAEVTKAPMIAGLSEKAAADEAAMATEVASLSAKTAAEKAAADKKAAEEAAIKARGESDRQFCRRHLWGRQGRRRDQADVSQAGRPSSGSAHQAGLKAKGSSVSVHFPAAPTARSDIALRAGARGLHKLRVCGGLPLIRLDAFASIHLLPQGEKGVLTACLAPALPGTVTDLPARIHTAPFLSGPRPRDSLSA